MVKKRPRRRRAAPSLFDVTSATAAQQALLGWYVDFFHDEIDRDPEFRRKVREHTAWMFERLAKGLREANGEA